MFEVIERPPLAWRAFALHSAAVVFVVPLLGLLNYWGTLFAGAILAFFVTRRGRQQAAVFARVPAFILFSWAAWDPITTWDRSWSHMSHWDYFTNTMFGPNCGSSECLYTVFTALLTGGISYSLTAYFLARRSRKNIGSP